MPADTARAVAPAGRPATTHGRTSLGGFAIEWTRWDPPPTGGPTLVLLHEGLGCVSLWRDLPAELAHRTGCPVLACSRAGYGGSDPCPLPRPLTWLDDEARDHLPAALAGFGMGAHVLIGHSDGASIALIRAGTPGAAAGRAPAPGPLLGVVAIAPHVFVEPVTVAAIAATRERFRTGDLRARLARHHGANVDCAFNGWADAWLDPGFAAWHALDACTRITVPLLLVQGRDDPYGSTGQLDAIRARTRGPLQQVLLAGCGHAPHVERRAAVLDVVARFVAARHADGTLPADPSPDPSPDPSTGAMR